MMKKTILSMMFALSVFGAAVFAQDDTTETTAKEASAPKSETVKADQTPAALGKDKTKHIPTNVPQGGTPKSQKPVGVVKN